MVDANGWEEERSTLVWDRRWPSSIGRIFSARVPSQPETIMLRVIGAGLRREHLSCHVRTPGFVLHRLRGGLERRGGAEVLLPVRIERTTETGLAVCSVEVSLPPSARSASCLVRVARRRVTVPRTRRPQFTITRRAVEMRRDVRGRFGDRS